MGFAPRYANLAFEQPIVADGARAQVFQRDSFSHARGAEAIDRGKSRAENFRRDEQRDAIDHSCAERGGGQMGSAFDHDF